MRLSPYVERERESCLLPTIINETDIGIFIHMNYENKDIYALLINNLVNYEDYKDSKVVKINNPKFQTLLK